MRRGLGPTSRGKDLFPEPFPERDGICKPSSFHSVFTDKGIWHAFSQNGQCRRGERPRDAPAMRNHPQGSLSYAIFSRFWSFGSYDHADDDRKATAHSLHPSREEPDALDTGHRPFPLSGRPFLVKQTDLSALSTYGRSSMVHRFLAWDRLATPISAGDIVTPSWVWLDIPSYLWKGLSCLSIQEEGGICRTIDLLGATEGAVLGIERCGIRARASEGA